MEDNQPGRGTRAPGATVPTPFAAGAAADAQAQMADELPDGLVVADDTGRVVVFNRAAVRLTSIAADEAIGTLTLLSRSEKRFGKDVRETFAAFDDKHPDRFSGGGDVKYHHGYSTDVVTSGGQ